LKEYPLSTGKIGDLGHAVELSLIFCHAKEWLTWFQDVGTQEKLAAGYRYEA